MIAFKYICLYLTGMFFYTFCSITFATVAELEVPFILGFIFGLAWAGYIAASYFIEYEKDI